MTTTPRPKRRTKRFLQFSLRSLLVFVLLVSIGMSWLGVKLERARKQREAVEAIEEAGGEVTYDYEWETRTSVIPSVSEWARAFFWDDFFCDVVDVTVCPGDFGDDEVIHLKRLTELEHLSIYYAQLTDAGLEHVAGLPNLTNLTLNGMQFTDAGLEHLEDLTTLHSLRLGEAQVSDAGLEHLEGLTNLEWLDLQGTQITDAGLEHLEGLTNLDYLNLTDTQVTAEGVKKLQRALPQCGIAHDG